MTYVKPTGLSYFAGAAIIVVGIILPLAFIVRFPLHAAWRFYNALRSSARSRR
jgi:hypothetical protein